MRIARAYTGRSRIVKLAGHFHGWRDGAVAAVNPPYEVPMSAGVPGATLEQVVICPPNDIKAVGVVFERGDVAAVILEPAGGQAGTTPTIPGYLQELRALTTRHGVVLIFDEVITGFRYSPGGAQAYFGVPGTCYGEASIYHVSFEGKPGLAGFDRPRKGSLYHLLRCALLNNGVDCSANHGWISALHTEEDLGRTLQGYERAFRAMAADAAFTSA